MSGFFALAVWHPSCFLPVGALKTMAYVIVDTCTKDNHCIEACPVNCIHPTPDESGYEEVPQLYIHPTECIDCGACVPVCPTNSIYILDELPAELAHFAEKNAAYYN
jgi:NAD-dependent dihydropyrimidine dehydrogenase PreA subunit